MITTECIESYRIKKYNGCDPSSIAHANKSFYLCYPKAFAILCFNECFEPQQVYSVNGSYFDVCYDEDRNQFYALDVENPTSVFILNANFCEISTIFLLNNQDDLPVSITYYNDCIYIAYKTYVLCIDNSKKQEIIMSCQSSIISIDATSSNLVVLEKQEPLYALNLWSYDKDCLACKELYREEQIYAITMVNSHAYFLSQDHACNFMILDITLCLETCIPTCDNQLACTLYDSGEIEKGIACILNSEGMKIQYAIEKGAPICELLKINQSVTNVINEVTQLELSLYTKLSKLITEDYISCDGFLSNGVCKR